MYRYHALKRGGRGEKLRKLAVELSSCAIYKLIKKSKNHYDRSPCSLGSKEALLRSILTLRSSYFRAWINAVKGNCGKKLIQEIATISLSTRSLIIGQMFIVK